MIQVVEFSVLTKDDKQTLNLDEVFPPSYVLEIQERQIEEDGNEGERY